MNDHITIAKLDTTKSKTKKIVVEVYYNKGGANFFSGTQEPRGYWVSVTPADVDGPITTVTLTSGARKFLEQSKRFSRKTLEKLVAQVQADPGIYKKILDIVLTKGTLVLKKAKGAS